MVSASYFNDVADTPYKGAINLLYKEEIVSGVGNGAYEPNRYVRYTEACKMLVKALGYHVIVSDTSLNSYTFLAGTIGVTDSVDSSKEYITVRDMLIMVDNCLDIGKMVPMYYNDDITPSYVIDDDDTFRNDFETPTPDGTIKMEGMVTADVSTYMYTERTSMKDTQIEISGRIFDFEGVAPLGFVGKHVYFYVQIDSEGNYGNVVSIASTNKNTVVNISGNDVSAYSKNEIKYFITEKKTTEIETTAGTKWIYNGVPGDYCLDIVDLEGNVQISAIDNNEDEVFDVVFVYEYSDAIVESIDAENLTVAFKNGSYYKNEKYLDFDEDDNNISVKYFDKDGKATTFAAITNDAVLSIARSKDGSKYRIVICNESGTGLVESKDGKYITIGTTEYEALNLDTTSIKVGRNYNYKINFANRLIWLEEVKVTTNYAYVYQLSDAKGLGNPKIRLIIPAKVSSKTLQGEYDEENNQAVTSTNLYIRNEEFLVYNLANKVDMHYYDAIYDDRGKLLEYRWTEEKVSPTVEKLTDIVGYPVTFEVDADNNIKTLHVPEGFSVGYKPTYNSSEKILGKITTIESLCWGIDDTTYAVCVPTNDASEDDILNYIKELMNGTTNTVDAYDVDKDTHIAGLLVVSDNMISGNPGVVESTRNYIGMVTKANRVLNEDGSESIMIKMITKADAKSFSEQSFEVSPLIPNYDSFENISTGDFIKYSLDGFDRLDGFEIKQRFEEYYDNDEGNEDSDKIVCGIVTDIDYDEVDNNKLRWADKVTLVSSGDTYSYYMHHNTSLTPMVCILNSADRSSKLGSVSDIRYGDRIFIYAYDGDAYAVVIYR